MRNENSVSGQPHNNAIVQILADKRIAIATLKRYLPANILEALDLDSLELTQDSFISDKLKAHHTDVVYQGKFNGKPGYIWFIFEHISNARFWSTVQVTEYIWASLAFWRAQNVKNDSRKKRLPTVYPILLHHGKKPYPHSTDFTDYFDDVDLAKDIHHKPYLMIDYTKLPTEELRQEAWSGTLGLLMKAAFYRGDVWGTIKYLTELMYSLKIQGYDIRELAITVHVYLQTVREDVELEQLRELVVEQSDPEMGDFVMTAGQRLIEQGYQQGVNQEKHQIAANMLNKGSDTTFVAEVTGLSLDEVERLKTQTEH